MCNEAVDDTLATLKLIHNWFVTSKMIKKLFTALYADENILYFTEYRYIDLNNTNLDNDFDEDDPDTIILLRLLAWHIKFENRKELEKMISEELIAIAWHPNRLWNFCVPEDYKKEIVSVFTK